MKLQSLIKTCGLTLVFVLAGCAGNPVDKLEPFTSDGCSSFPDGTLKQRELWLSCCVSHDKAYWVGGTYQERLDADKELETCVAKVGEPEIAKLMLAGVRVGGSPYWPTTYRWGYGWDYPRGYKVLSTEEKVLAEKLLEAYEQAQAEEKDKSE